jgi:hypothetical protein
MGLDGPAALCDHALAMTPDIDRLLDDLKTLRQFGGDADQGRPAARVFRC